MRKDYHLHPSLVSAPQNFDAFAWKAIERGFQEICITDHMPTSCSTASDRIKAGRVSDYCQAVKELSRQYEGQLRIKCGIEIDYDPAYLGEIEDVLSAGEFDFVLGSVHLHVCRPGLFDGKTTHNEYARKCLEITSQAARSGFFHAIAHFDFFRWVFTQPKRFPLADDGYSCQAHWPLIHETLDSIRKAGLLLEVNPQKNMFPQKEIATLALKKDLRFYYGSDAHSAQDVGMLYEELLGDPVYSQALWKWESET
jgi:histidinol-phosphatase (PHP family)